MPVGDVVAHLEAVYVNQDREWWQSPGMIKAPAGQGLGEAVVVSFDLDAIVLGGLFPEFGELEPQHTVIE